KTKGTIFDNNICQFAAGVINNCSKVPVSFSRTTVTAETNVLINVKSLS
ncbi:MAG: hypothetical protein RLZZ203_63, partial [Cyanobacteriota bacterium]